MKLISFFLIFLFLVSCKDKEPVKIAEVPKMEVTKEGKIFPIDSAKIGAIKDSSVIFFYNAIQNKTFWLTDLNRKNIVTLFNNVQNEGLFTKDFDLKKIQNSEEKIDNLSKSALINYDILLTENLSRYIQKVSKGNLDPNKLYSNWELKEKKERLLIKLKKLLIMS